MELFTLNLRLQAPAPSDQLWRTLLLSVTPQFLYQAPPGAQQLTRPDFLNVPHFGHRTAPIIAEPGVVSELLIDVLAVRNCASHR